MQHIFETLGKWRNLIILEYFLTRPSISTYPAVLLKELNVSRKSLFDALSELEKEGILSKKSIGKTTLYSLEKENVAVKQLKLLLSLSKLEPLKKIMKNCNCEIYVFGSVSRGEDNEHSDVDILAITDEEKGKIAGLIAKAKIKNVKPIIVTPIDYANLSRADRAFYERIEKDRLRLI